LKIPVILVELGGIMKNRSAILEKAMRESRKTLSEYESKNFLKSYGIPVTREILVHSREECLKRPMPLAIPLSQGMLPHLAHKTEKGLVRVDIRSEQETIAALMISRPVWKGMQRTSWFRK